MRAPRLAEALIRWTAPRDRTDDLLGDLREVHARRVARRGSVRAAVVSSFESMALALSLLGARARRFRVSDLVSPGEVRLAVRLIGRHPFMSMTSVLALAVGITIATAGFTVLNSLLNPTVPLDDAARVVEVSLIESGTGRGVDLPPGAYATWRDGVEGLRHLSAVRHRKMNLKYPGGDVELIDGAELTPRTFEVLPFVAVAGRRLTPADAEPGAPPVVVMREGLWRRQFGGERSAMGTRVDVNGVERTLVGVLPDTATFPTAPDLWMPLADETLEAAGPRELRGVGLNGFLRDGYEPEEVEAQMTALLTGLPAVREHPERILADVRGVGELEAAALPGGLMLAVLAALLVVVASNVGNLVVARNAVRRQELAVRSALGAGRRRIVAQLTIEVLVMVAIAAMIGLVASNFLLNGLGGDADDLPPWVDFSLNPRIAGFVVLLTALATLFAGLLPALHATRGDLGASLHAGPGASLREAFGRRNDLAIVAQVALSIGILGAASMIHLGWAGSYASRLPDVPLNRVLTARVTLAGHPEAPEADALAPSEASARRAAITAVLTDLPDVVRVGAGSHVPGMDARSLRFEVESRGTGTAAEAYPTAWIGPDYLAALEVEPLAGRGFLPADHVADAVPVALVNEPFVERHLGGRNPIGLRVRPVARDGSPGAWHEVVGVLPDLGMSAADPERNGGVYLPLISEVGFWIFLNTTAPPASLADVVQRTTYEAVPDASVDAATVMMERIAVRRRIFLAMGSVVTSVGAMVLLLSLTAIYAILSFEVTRRTPEFGIRAALGATRSQITRPVLRRVAGYVAAGGLLGSGFGAVLIALARGLFVMRFPPTGPWLFAGLLAAVTLAALAAGWVPMRRAVRIDPMRALRSE